MNKELLTHYKERIIQFNVENKTLEKGGIVFVGDSITEKYPLKEFFPNKQIINRGISGDSTKGLLKRLVPSVLACDPSLVLILIGTNDFGHFSHQSPQAVYETISKAIAQIQLRLPNTKIYLQAIYPVNRHINQEVVNSRDNQDIIIVNKLLKEIAGITFLDYFDMLSDDSKALSTAYTDDGLHLNHDGYSFVTTLLKKSISELN